MIDVTLIGDVTESDKDLLYSWLLKRKMDLGDTEGEHIQLPNGHRYDFSIFKDDVDYYEVTLQRSYIDESVLGRQD